MVGVALPLALALAVSLGEAAQTAAWRGLLDDPQTGPALRASLVSGLGSTLIATALSLWLTTCLWAHPRWTALQRRLPAMLAVPHAALAIGLLLLWMPGGWIARLLAPLAGWDVPPDWTTVNDPHALALTLALVLKETPFLLWTIAALLARPDVAPRLRQQLALGRSLGYTPAQVWWRVVWPQSSCSKSAPCTPPRRWKCAPAPRRWRCWLRCPVRGWCLRRSKIGRRSTWRPSSA